MIDDDASATIVRQRPSPPPPAPLPRYLEALREQQAPKAALSALLAWFVTIAPAGFAREGTILSALAAVAALFAGVGGPALIPWRRQVARHVGISAFVALAVATWLAASPWLNPLRLDPVRGITGAIAWGVYALSWSERWIVASPPAQDPDAPLLQARATLPRSAIAVLGLGAATSLVMITLAWRARDPERALLAHAVALGAAVALVTSAASVAVSRGKARSRPLRRLPSRATRALILLVGVAIVGAIAMVVAR